MKTFVKNLQRRVLLMLAPKLGLCYLYCAGLTSKVITVGTEDLAQLRAQHPRVIFAGWHEQSLLLAWLTRHQGMTMLVSHSRDGEYIAAILRALGYAVVRGSSSRGGSQAVRQLLRTLRHRGDVGLIVDGPRGPALECKPGVVTLAQLSGAPIVPVAAFGSRAMRVKSWDRTYVPLPFATMRIHFGHPIFCAGRDDPDDLTRAQHQVNQALNDLTQAARAAHGQARDHKNSSPARENS